MYSQILDHISRDISLTSYEKEEFTGILSEKKILKKELLIHPGDQVYSEYYVVKGCLKAYYRDQAG